MKIFWLPPYWPHLETVEFVFGLVMGHIKNSDQNKSIDYSKRSWKRVMAAGLQYITKEELSRCGARQSELLEKPF